MPVHAPDSRRPVTCGSTCSRPASWGVIAKASQCVGQLRHPACACHADTHTQRTRSAAVTGGAHHQAASWCGDTSESIGQTWWPGKFPAW